MRKATPYCALLASTALIAGAAPAAAQTTSPPPPVETPAPQSDRASDAMMEDVVVTAQKKTQGEALQQVPIAATAFGQNQLQAMQFRNLESITLSSPNVQLDSGGTQKGTANFTIRGLGVNSSVISVEPTVGTFVDGVYLGTNFGVVLDTFDIESIEVLRGPQGVLFGRNVTGGAVSIRTRRPTGEFAVNGRLSLDSGLGDRGITATAAGSVEGSLVKDHLFAKVTGYYAHDDGYFRDTTLGRNVGDSRTWFVRPTLVYEADGGFNTTLIGEHGETNGDGPVAYNPGGTVQARPFTSAENLAGFTHLRYNSITSETNVPVGLGDGQITNVAGYRDLRFRSAQDIDGSPRDVYNILYQARTHQFSDELRYAGRFVDRVDLVTGLYYFTQDIFFLARDDLRYIARYRDYGGKQHQTTLGAFANVDLDVTSKLTLSAGARYSRDRKHALVVTGVLTPAAQLCDVIAFTCSAYPFDNARTFTSFTPRFVAKYQFTPAIQAYASYSKGYRAGGYNIRNTAAAPPGPYGDEQANSYEIGFKGDFFDHALRLDVAAFTNLVRNAQRQNVVVLPTGSQTVLGNAGDERLKGIEGNASARLFRGFVARGFFGYTRGYYTRVTQDINGDRVVDGRDLALKLPRLAPWTYGGGVTWDIDAGEAGRVSMQSDIAHRDKSFFDDGNTGILPAYDDLSANIALTPRQIPGLKLSIFGKNLLDRVSLELNQNLATLPTGGQISVLKKGRIVGVEANFRL